MSWHDDTKQLIDFARAMKDAGAVEEMDDVISRPYKYQAYYDLWAENDYPQEDDEEWEAWVNAIATDGE